MSQMLAAAMTGSPEATSRMTAIADFIAQTRTMHPICMSCDAEVPIEPPPDLATLAVLEPGFGQTPTSGVLIMAICKACDARQNTHAAFEADVLKAVRRGMMRDDAGCPQRSSFTIRPRLRIPFTERQDTLVVSFAHAHRASLPIQRDARG